MAGYCFASIGRYAQSGLIRERFPPRLLRVAAQDITTTGEGANLDPFRAWAVMMTGEKPRRPRRTMCRGRHPSHGPLDAAAKIAGMPMHHFLAGRLGRSDSASQVPVYASGGYPYPDSGHSVGASSCAVSMSIRVGKAASHQIGLICG